MSTWKAASSDASRRTNVTPRIGAATKRPPAPLVDVVSLSIDDEEDTGSDPYNHTGQFVKPEFDEQSG